MQNYLSLTWDQFAADTAKLCDKLRQQDKKWHILVAIARGGLVPAAIIANQLGIRWVDTVCINSYDDETFQQQELQILKELKSNNQDILVIDDLVDSGKTFALVKEMLPKAHYAAIYAKPSGKTSADTYLKEVSQDTWLVFPWEEQVEEKKAIA